MLGSTTGPLTSNRNERRTPLRRRLLPLALFLSICPATSLAQGKWSGFFSTEFRFFPNGPLFTEQSRRDLSLAFQSEYYLDWDHGMQSVNFVPFLRLDQQDPQRTHFDIRELAWQMAAERWELRVGVRRIFWGVTESYHLVDIINQTDLVEDIDGEDKLGQPMVNFAWIEPWGTIDFFFLPGFRERRFPSSQGRFRPALEVSEAQFESAAGKSHLDWALRWSQSWGPWDLGVAHFAGTSREPRFLFSQDEAGEPVLVPFYGQIQQTSLDLQATTGSWLFKLESASRAGSDGRSSALVGGFEYTFFNVFGSGAELGALSEYLYDERGNEAPTPFEDDVFVGTRLAFNDEQSTDLLAGVIFDRDSSARFISIEGSRRLGASFKLMVNARAFTGVPNTDQFFTFRSDDYIHLALAWYF